MSGYNTRFLTSVSSSTAFGSNRVALSMPPRGRHHPSREADLPYNALLSPAIDALRKCKPQNKALLVDSQETLVGPQTHKDDPLPVEERLVKPASLAAEVGRPTDLS